MISYPLSLKVKSFEELENPTSKDYMDMFHLYSHAGDEHTAHTYSNKALFQERFEKKTNPDAIDYEDIAGSFFYIKNHKQALKYYEKYFDNNNDKSSYRYTLFQINVPIAIDEVLKTSPNSKDKNNINRIINKIISHNNSEEFQSNILELAKKYNIELQTSS